MFIPYIGGFNGVLDSLGIAENAVFIFSPYKRLIKSYIGKAIRVQRTTDYTSMDIGFNPDGTINQTELLSFCGVGDGLVEIVYNQAGYNNAIQSTLNNKPKVVVSGVFQANGLLFDGVDDVMTVVKYVAINITTPELSVFCKIFNSVTSAGYIYAIDKNSSTVQNAAFRTSSALYSRINAVSDAVNYTVDTESNFMLVWNNINRITKTDVDESSISADLSAIERDFFNIGARGADNLNLTHQSHLEVYIKSLVFFNTDEYANYNGLKEI